MQAIPYLISATNNSGEATRLIYSLFVNKPYIFGDNAECLMYSLHVGGGTKADAVQTIMQNIIANRNSTLSDNNPYYNDPSSIVSWARIVRDNKKCIVFEPVMQKLTKSLKNFSNTTPVNVEGRNINIAQLIPICYDKSGNNYASLLPYIGYVAAFLLYCKPYQFADSFSNASGTIYSKEVEKYYRVCIAALERDTGIDFIAEDLGILTKFDNATLSTMFGQMLKPTQIQTIRDSVIKIDDLLYKENVNEQELLTQEYVDKAYMQTMELILSMVIKYNPIKELLSKLPAPKPSMSFYNSNVLTDITSYVLAGGNAPICVNDTGAFNYLITDASSLPTSLKSSIRPLAKSTKMPFTSGDIVLNIVNSYVAERYEEFVNDPLTFDAASSMFDIKVSCNNIDFTHSRKLMEFYGNARWNAYCSTLKGFKLANRDDILELSDTVMTLYNAQDLQATLLSTYVFASIPSYLLMHITRGMPLETPAEGDAGGRSLRGTSSIAGIAGTPKTFKPYEYLYNTSFDSALATRLHDVLLAIMYVENKNYCNFVNKCAQYCMSVLESGSTTCLVPYVKGLNDLADAYAIGGVELYKYSSHSNPLIRSYEIIKSVYGTCDALECFAHIVSQITNPSVFEVIDETSVSLDSILKPSLTKLKQSDIPPTLYNYTITASDARQIAPDSVLSFNVAGEPITTMIKTYIFKKSDAVSYSNLSIFTRELMLKGSSASVGKIENGAKVKLGGSISAFAPIYDIKGEVVPLEMTFAPQYKNKKLVQVFINTNGNAKNMVVWLFTDVPYLTRYKCLELLRA